jgi:hypothetical protein
MACWLIPRTRNPEQKVEMTPGNSAGLRKELGPGRSIAWKLKRLKWYRRILGGRNGGLSRTCTGKLAACLLDRMRCSERSRLRPYKCEHLVSIRQARMRRVLRRMFLLIIAT